MQPLNLNLAGVDTSMPVLLPGKYPVEIDGVPTQEESKKNPGFFNLKVKFKTRDEATTHDGKHVPAGFPLTNYYQIPGMCNPDNEEMASKNLALFQLAVLNLPNKEEHVASLPPFDDQFLNDLPGKLVMANVKTVKSEEYGDSSKVASVACVG